MTVVCSGTSFFELRRHRLEVLDARAHDEALPAARTLRRQRVADGGVVERPDPVLTGLRRLGGVAMMLRSLSPTKPAEAFAESASPSL